MLFGVASFAGIAGAGTNSGLSTITIASAVVASAANEAISPVLVFPY